MDLPMKIGLLKCGQTLPEVIEGHGDFDAMFIRLLAPYGFDFEVWDVEHMDFPASVEDADGWLLTGSKHGAYEDHAFIPPLEDFIRRAWAAAVPMVGICFGHQIIAQALGGKVVKFPGGWAVGRRTYDFDGLGEIALNAWHQDQVVELPPDARVVARNDFTEAAALRYGDTVFTLQPHPELSPEMIRIYVDVRKDMPTYPRPMMEQAAADCALPTDAARIAAEIAAHFRAAVAAEPLRSAAHG
jgi:GMP synthase-like glutamine amidotransferase